MADDYESLTVKQLKEEVAKRDGLTIKSTLRKAEIIEKLREWDQEQATEPQVEAQAETEPEAEPETEATPPLPPVAEESNATNKGDEEVHRVAAAACSSACVASPLGAVIAPSGTAPLGSKESPA